MRLTLRTLLAYMDRILEPEDAEDIGKKIEESEYATNLLHRTRDVMRRLRLAAPNLADRGPGLDANTVAEYLDNTLDDSRVADFEKVCLDSDVHLAEVASCHQILTLVLGEPAEIDPASRQRMYQLPNLEAAQAEPQSGAAAAEPPVGDQQPNGGATGRRRRRKPTVPDYLRDPRKRRRLLPAAAALGLALCGIVVVLYALGQFEPDSRLGKLLGFAPAQLAEGPQDQGGPGPSGEQRPETATPDTGRSAKGPSLPEHRVAPGPEPADRSEPETPGDTPPVPVPPGPEAPDKPGPETPGDTRPAPVPPGPETPDKPARGTPGDTQPEPAPPRIMGRFMSDRQVLLRFDSESATWLRVPAKEALYPHAKLVVPPTYRDEITLGTGVSLELFGETEIELLPGSDQELAGLRVRYGRVFMMPLAEAGTKLRLVVGRRSGVITFADAESMVALEVTPVRIAGTNPETQPPLVVAELYANPASPDSTGDVLWDEGADQETVRVMAGNCLILDEQPKAPVAVQEFPKWMATDALSLLDHRASSTLEKSLEADRPAVLRLLELADDTRREVSWLATRCLGYIGEFGPLVAGLNDPDKKARWPNWEDHIVHLQAAVARGPEAATQVYEAMKKEYGKDAADLFRMLWGYTEEGLRNRDPSDLNQDAWDLVDLLNQEALALRVVSFWNLSNIFGLRLSYKPEETAARRRQPIQEWKNRLKSEETWTRVSGRKAPPPDKKAPPPEGVEPQP